MNQIQPADRVLRIKEYYFSRKLKEISVLRAKGEDIISLGIGGPDMPPPAPAVKAATACMERKDSHSYQPTIGLPELRKAFADWYASFYDVKGINPEADILPLIGSKEGIINISLAFLNPGDGVLVPNPGYPTYSSASEIVNAKVFTYDLKEEEGWIPDFNALEQLPTEIIKLMWVNYPHMPTGTPATIELFERLIDFGRKHNIVIVNDNPYSFILNPRPLSIMQVSGAREICIEMNSLSKCFNMAGWRVGVLLSNPKFISWILKVKSNMDSGQPRAIMEGAIAALSQPSEWYAGINREYIGRQDIAAEIMEALNCRCKKGQQGLFLWGRIPDDAGGSEEFADEILHKAKVFITPGFIFGSGGERHVRISLCAPKEILKEALKRIRETKICR